MRPVLFVTLLALSLAACRKPPGPAEFEALTRDFTEGALALSPATATAAGYHAHQGRSLDGELDDLSAAGIERQRRFWRDWQSRLARLDVEGLDAESRADLALMRSQADLSLLELDVIQAWKHNPTVYVELLGNALFAPFSVNYDAENARFSHIISRLKVLPRFLDGAKSNLQGVPGVWRRVAIEENEGNIALVEKTIRAGVPAALKSDYDAAAEPALAALNAFNGFLRQLPDAGEESWRLGAENYGRKFALVMGGTRSVEESLKEAEQDLLNVRKEMFQIALPLHHQWYPSHRDPVDLNLIVGEVLSKVAEKRPKRDAYFEEAKRTLAETRAFLREHEKGLVKSPPHDNLQLIETPAFMRGIYGVGGFNPAPVLQPELGAFYWLTPIPKEWPEERVQSKLKEYNDYGLRILTIHEAIPGHYVQFEYANAIEPKARRVLRALFGSGVYVEGWAVYATDAMIEAGYMNRSPELKLTFLKQLLRAIANAILDVRLHTRGMTESEAMALMVTQTFQEREEAVAKWQRAQLSSCQLPTYYAGYKEWKRLRAAMEQKPGFQPGEFHERALKAGALPMKTLSDLMGASATAGTPK